MAVALGMAVGVAFITGSYTTAVRKGITDDLTANLHGVAVSTLEPNNTYNIDAKFSNDAIEKIRALPSVDKVNRGAGLVVGHSKVLGVQQDGDFGGSNVQMSFALLEQIYGPQPVSGVNVIPKTGISDEQLREEIKAANIDPDLRVQTASELASDISEGVETQLQSFWTLQRSLLATAFVAVFSTLLLVGVQRRREFGLLAAVGMQPKELARMVLFEAALVGAVGAVVGLFASIWMYAGLLLIAPVLIGFKEPFVIDAGTAVVYAFVAIAIALLGAAFPAWRTSRIEVLEALQYE
jgi:putative ABC transport system permease protein